jgi:putative ABC transport system substrate-binding protein
MRRRDAIGMMAVLGALRPLAARAQSQPLVGFLSSVSQAQTPHLVAAFKRGLGESGFTEGNNATIDYRFADGQYDRLPGLAAELVRRQASVIVTPGPPAANAAKAAAGAIPIVFIVGLDPVAAGLVASFNRPGGNATGISMITGPMAQKRLELARELAPKATTVVILINPTSPDAAPEIRETEAAAKANGIELVPLNASTPGELAAALGSLPGRGVGALLVGADPFFMVLRAEIIAAVARSRIPAVYPFREFVSVGGLMSYGTNVANAYRQAGIYAGRILKGSKPADLPVLTPTTFELVINLKAAQDQGIQIPPALHARSDEVIE